MMKGQLHTYLTIIFYRKSDLLNVGLLWSIFCLAACHEGKRDEVMIVRLDSLRDIATVYYEQGRYSEAVHVYNQILAEDTLDGKPFFRRAYSLCHELRYEEAIPDYLKSASLGFEQFESLYSVGMIYLVNFGNDSLATYYLKESLELKPDSEVVKQILSRIQTHRIAM